MTTGTQTGFTRIAADLQPPAARITLNNPPLNVIDVQMMDELRAALEQIDARPEISAIVFAGSERAFSGGVDIAAHTPDKVRDMLTAFHSVIRSVVDNSKLTIASVRRHCLGRRRGTGDDVRCGLRFGRFSLGISRDQAGVLCRRSRAWLCPPLWDRSWRQNSLLTGRTLNGQEALEAGLVNGLADDPETLVADCVQRVSQLSPVALALAKKAFYAWDSIHFDKGLARAEQIYFDELMKTADAQEGVAAFIERRRPKWVAK